MSRTGVSTGAGAKTRWAGIFAGLWLALIVLMIGEYAELIPMAVIGGLIVVIGVELAWERYADIVLVLRTSWYSSLAMVVTFLATTQIPLQNAIILGAAISILLYCVQAARQASLTALVHDSDGRWHTEDPPDRIEPGSVTVLNYSGVAFFAEVHRIAEQWPAMDDARNAAIVLRVPDIPDIPSSGMLKTLERYQKRLGQQGGRRFLAGAHPVFEQRLRRSGLAERLGDHSVFEEGDLIFGALDEAYAAAQQWVDGQAHEA